MKSYVITGVNKITQIEKPIIVFNVQGQKLGIARNPKQVILDLQNSLRLASDVNSINDPRFDEALRRSIGGTITGDIKFFKAGDEYLVEEGHPALTDATHEMYGKVKEGDKLNAKSDGAWVEGFLQIVFSQQQDLNLTIASNIADSFRNMFNNVPATPVAPVQPVEITDTPVFEAENTSTMKEAVA